MAAIRSRNNPRVRRWQRLVRETGERRRERRALIEGPHLLETWVAHRGAPACVMVAESALSGAGIAALARRFEGIAVVLADAVMRAITDVRAPQGIAAEIAIPEPREPLGRASSCVFLDGVQDAGNVGAILRSAAAFGFVDVVLGAGCADPWSPKVLRAAAGAHAVLCIRESQDLGAAIDAFGGSTYWTAPRGGIAPGVADLAGRTGWIFGSEGQGVAPGVAARAAGAVTIPLAAGSESLNVAAAAAVCLYESRRRREPQ